MVLQNDNLVRARNSIMARYIMALGVGALLAGSAMAVRSVAGDEVVDNSVIAHIRLKGLAVALSIYLNDNLERLDDPVHLLQSVEIEPEAFWHPGDNDPAPTQIDNSIPNAANSAQISFLFQTGFLGGLAGDDPIIWDASPFNNDSQFISYATFDGGIETIPPVELPFPTNVSIAQKHLWRISRALWWYQNDNGGFLPVSLLDAHPNYALAWPRSFWNPGDADPMPTAITNDQPDGLNSTNISFEYLVGGMHLDDITVDTIVLQDNTPENNKGLGINVANGRALMFQAGGVQFIPVNSFGDYDGDQDIDLHDWAAFQSCYSGFPGEIDDDTCRVLDFNSDGHIAMNDYGFFVDVVTGPALP